MRKKKILSAVISAAMAFGFMSYMPQTEVFETMTAEAESYSDNIAYGDYLTIQKVDEENDGTYDYVKIYDCDDSATEIDIPSEIEGLPVTIIGYKAFYNNDNLKNVTIPDSVISIEDHSFGTCDGLKSITIPDSVISIGEGSFSGCDYLANVTIGKSVTSIEKEAFAYSINLISITIPDSVITIGDWAFRQCNNLANVTIGENVTSIGYKAFYQCYDIISITIPESVTNIGDCAFDDCSRITSVIIENPECEIYDSKSTIYSTKATIYGHENSTAQAYAEKYDFAFDLIENVPAQTPPTVTEPSKSDLEKLSYIKVDEDEDGTLDYIEITACDSSSVSVNIPSEIDGLPVTSIGNWAFNICQALENITIPESITSIGAGVFSGTPWLQTKIAENPLVIVNNIVIAGSSCSGDVVIPDGVTNIAGYAFSLAYNMTSVTIPDSVKNIGDYAFYDCDKLESIVIPNGVTSIGTGAFYSCESLKSVTIPETVKSIGDHAFNEILLESITIKNPDCEIFDSKYSITDNATIYGYSDSTAHTYAEKYDREFISLGEAPVITTTVTTVNPTTSTTVTTTITTEPTETLVGDANGDGETNIRDAAYIATALANGEVDKLPPSADFNGDGKANIRDAAGMAAALAKGEI